MLYLMVRRLDVWYPEPSQHRFQRDTDNNLNPEIHSEKSQPLHFASETS